MLVKVEGIAGLRPIVEAHLGHVVDGHLIEIKRRKAAALAGVGRKAVLGVEIAFSAVMT